MKLLKNLVFALSLIALAWVFASWVEVICLNTTVNPTYSWWNLFAIFCA